VSTALRRERDRSQSLGITESRQFVYATQKSPRFIQPTQMRAQKAPISEFVHAPPSSGGVGNRISLNLIRHVAPTGILT
jgi:hypothetical protein